MEESLIYRSNLTCPDFSPHFKHLFSRPMPHSFGHDVPSDWADKADDDSVFGLYKRCGFWTHDEAAILWNVAERAIASRALDIGCHTGWTTWHMAAPGTSIAAIDPMLRVPEFRDRFIENNAPAGYSFLRSEQYFAPLAPAATFGLVCVDGDHSPGKPLEDAQNALDQITSNGVIIFHDGTGKPVREAVEFLIREGMRCRAYFTPHLVFCCWRGDFVPPDHTPDPAVKRAHLDGRYPDFYFGRCE